MLTLTHIDLKITGSFARMQFFLHTGFLYFDTKMQTIYMRTNIFIIIIKKIQKIIDFLSKLMYTIYILKAVELMISENDVRLL